MFAATLRRRISVGSRAAFDLRSIPSERFENLSMILCRFRRASTRALFQFPSGKSSTGCQMNLQMNSKSSISSDTELHAWNPRSARKAETSHAIPRRASPLSSSASDTVPPELASRRTSASATLSKSTMNSSLILLSSCCFICRCRASRDSTRWRRIISSEECCTAVDERLPLSAFSPLAPSADLRRSWPISEIFCVCAMLV
mmetsp:Transcript_67004/g.159853  ORF Transcript_67004/g.159853 Transcript_67004/m.159853 type:complete len:202 (+) Transcript_67004:451-1056(+)